MRTLFVLLLSVSVIALAGSRVKEITVAQGVVPTTLADGGTTDGVSLSEIEGCRISARVSDGGTINGGVIGVYYYDSAIGWVRASTALDCTLEASKLFDGGAPAAQVCPDLGILAKYGRISATNKSLVGIDGGAVTATIRTECWGRNLP